MGFLDPVFDPLLSLPLLWVIIIVSLLVSLVITLVYKYFTNQDLMKQLKDEIKALQKEMKELKDNPQEMMKVQKKAMETNMKYMMQSFRSTLITFIPIILIFGWMNANVAFIPIHPGEEFVVDVALAKAAPATTITAAVPQGIENKGEAQKMVDAGGIGKFVFTAEGAGTYDLAFSAQNTTLQKRVIVTTKQEYENPILKGKKGDPIATVTTVHEKEKLLNLFGWKLGWLGTYIIFSIVFSMGLRKLLKVY